MTAGLARFFAQLYDITTHRLRGDGHLSEMLVIVTKVHGEEHLKNTKSEVQCLKVWWKTIKQNFTL